MPCGHEAEGIHSVFDIGVDLYYVGYVCLLTRHVCLH